MHWGLLIWWFWKPDFQGDSHFEASKTDLKSIISFSRPSPSGAVSPDSHPAQIINHMNDNHQPTTEDGSCTWGAGVTIEVLAFLSPSPGPSLCPGRGLCAAGPSRPA